MWDMYHRARGWGGKRSSIVELSVTRFFFWHKSCFFLTENFFGVIRVSFVFWRKLRMGEKALFSQKKKKGGGGHKNHPTTAIATGGGEAHSPHGHFGDLRHG